MTVTGIQMERFDGHLYAVTQYDNQTASWAGADAAAGGLDAGTGAWRLATITSTAENAFVTSLLHAPGPLSLYYFGLFQVDGQTHTKGGWTWVDGETSHFRNWNVGEPNNLGVEDFGTIYGNGFWNDLGATAVVAGAVYELAVTTALVMAGSAKADVLVGNHFGDQFQGLAGADQIFGRMGADTLIGGLGNDSLFGGNAADRLSGGDGADQFVFGHTGESRLSDPDRITDFTQGSDLINLVKINQNEIALGLPTLTFIQDLPFSATAPELRFAAAGSDTRVEIDKDGDGGEDFAVILTGNFTLTAADFAL